MDTVKWIGVGVATLFGITLAMFARAATSKKQSVSDFQIKETTDEQANKLTPYWTDEDFVKLYNNSKKVKQNPADSLLIIWSESGGNPKAVNRRSDGYPIAVGLNQLTSAANSLVGITEDERIDLVNQPVSRQLDLVDKFFSGLQWTKQGKSYDNAGVIYEANFAPGRMNSRGTDLDTVLYDTSDGVFYTQNKQLDKDNKGKITVQDLVNYLRTVSDKPSYNAALQRMRSATGENSLSPSLPG